MKFYKMFTFMPALAGLSFLSSGCSTMMSNSSVYAPKGSKDSGTIAYNAAGIRDVVRIRRNDALASIFEFCGNSNNYKITKEELREPKKDEDVGIAGMAATKMMFIDFKCVDKQ